MVMPVSHDPQFQRKLQIATAVAAALGIDLVTPIGSVAGVSSVSAHREMLSDCALVIADLSFESPSCYYELGLTDGLKKSVVVVAERGAVIHQTGGQHILWYSSIDEYEFIVNDAMRLVWWD